MQNVGPPRAVRADAGDNTDWRNHRWQADAADAASATDRTMAATASASAAGGEQQQQHWVKLEWDDDGGGGDSDNDGGAVVELHTPWCWTGRARSTRTGTRSRFLGRRRAPNRSGPPWLEAPARRTSSRSRTCRAATRPAPRIPRSVPLLHAVADDAAGIRPAAPCVLSPDHHRALRILVRRPPHARDDSTNNNKKGWNLSLWQVQVFGRRLSAPEAEQ